MEVRAPLAITRMRRARGNLMGLHQDASGILLGTAIVNTPGTNTVDVPFAVLRGITEVIYRVRTGCVYNSRTQQYTRRILM